MKARFTAQKNDKSTSYKQRLNVLENIRQGAEDFLEYEDSGAIVAWLGDVEQMETRKLNSQPITQASEEGKGKDYIVVGYKDENGNFQKTMSQKFKLLCTIARLAEKTSFLGICKPNEEEQELMSTEAMQVRMDSRESCVAVANEMRKYVQETLIPLSWLVTTSNKAWERGIVKLSKDTFHVLSLGNMDVFLKMHIAGTREKDQCKAGLGTNSLPEANLVIKVGSNTLSFRGTENIAKCKSVIQSFADARDELIRRMEKDSTAVEFKGQMEEIEAINALPFEMVNSRIDGDITFDHWNEIDAIPVEKGEKKPKSKMKMIDDGTVEFA